MPIESQFRTNSSDTAGVLPWEGGGFFEHCEPSRAETIPWPRPNVFFALARHVVPSILRINASIRRLWIPEYFCPDVVQHWSAFVETVLYRDDPSRLEPDWKSLKPDKHDLVVAVNYFGARSKEPWAWWRSSRGCVLLEDHSHDPLSEWALTSTADYVFSSLRKSMPVTDGAICWSPMGLRLPLPQGKLNTDAIDLKLAAMVEKADFLAGKAAPGSKAQYRELYARGDKCLEEGPESPISDRAWDCVCAGVPLRWRQMRERNVRTLLYSAGEMQNVRPLFVQWPSKSVPFAVVLTFANGKDRDSCRLYLEANYVFCPIHWLIVRPSLVSDLAARVLTIPADQRYDDSDMERVAKILNQWNLARQASK
jgi:hypothetical protein